MRSDRETGFSLIELVVVLTIVGVAAAIAAPRFTGAQLRYRADAAQRRVADDLRWLARHANATSATVSVTFDTANGTYGVPQLLDPDRSTQKYAVDLGQPPYRATIVKADFAGSNTLTFTGYGRPEADGSVVVAVGRESRTITVDAATGQVATP